MIRLPDAHDSVTFTVSCNRVILSTNKGGQIIFIVFSHLPNKVFLLPDSCRAIERMGNSISADVTYDTFENE